MLTKCVANVEVTFANILGSPIGVNKDAQVLAHVILSILTLIIRNYTNTSYYNFIAMMFFSICRNLSCEW